MDDQKMTSYKVPVEWVDRIFVRLNEIYGDRFIDKFGKPEIYELERTRWQSALIGCTAEEIKRVIEYCRTGFIKDAPNAIEFFHWCKGHKITPPKPHTVNAAPKSEIAKQYMDLIREKLNGRAKSNWQDAVSALNQQVLSKQDNKNTHWQDS